MPPTIRRAVPADVPQMVEFNCRLALETEGKTLDPPVVARAVAAALADPRKALYWVAEDADGLLGQISVTTEWSDWRNAWLWWIQSVYVKAEARRQGTFRALYNYVHQAALADPNVIGLRLYVERDNHVARQTYLRLGLELAPYVMLERFPLRPGDLGPSC
jgi:GNAT superfamily N-acetyltransferase